MTGRTNAKMRLVNTSTRKLRGCCRKWAASARSFLNILQRIKSEGIENLTNGKMGTANMFVCGAIVDGQPIPIDHMPIGKHHVPKKAGRLIRRSRLHNGPFATAEDDRWIFEVEQQCPQTIAVIGIGTVVDG